MVVFLHVAYFYNTTIVGGKNELFLFLEKVSVFTFMPYFMAAFFILNGYCSKNVRSFKESFEYGCKTLIIPVFFLNLWHQHWFCVSMFGGILIHSLLRRFSNKVNYIIYATLLLIGVTINKYGLDIFYLSYTLAYAPFIFLGEKVRCIVDNNKFAIISLIICLGLWAVYYYNKQYVIPYIAGSAFRVGFKDIPVFLITTICGSSSTFLISRLLKNVDILSKIGKHSLVIYLFHFNIIMLIEPMCVPLVDNASTIESALAFCLLYTISLTCSYIIAIIINKNIPWLIGKNKYI